MHVSRLVLVCIIIIHISGLSFGQDDPAITFSSYFGGSKMDIAGGIALDDDGNIYIAGTTNSPDFPVLNQIQEFRGGTFPGTDAFVAKFNADFELEYSTFIGGRRDELVTAIALGNDGSVVICGTTNSPDFPIVDSLQDYKGSPLLRSDAFITKLNPDGSEITFSTLLGGSGEEMINDIAIDENGVIYLAGMTTSYDFPTTENSFQPGFSGRGVVGIDAFAIKLIPDGSAYYYEYSSLLGGGNDESGNIVNYDNDGRLYLCGVTESPDFPLRDPVQFNLGDNIQSKGSGDIFIAIFSPDGTYLEFSSYFGGSSSDKCSGLNVENNRSLHITGYTNSHDFPVTGESYQDEISGSYDITLSHLTQSSDEKWTINSSTFLGSIENEIPGKSIDIDNGLITFAGVTDTINFPDENPIQVLLNSGGNDLFLIQFDSINMSPVFGIILGGSGNENIYGLSTNENGKYCITGITKSSDFPLQNSFFDQLNDDTLVTFESGDIYLLCLETAINTSYENDHTNRELYLRTYPNPVSDILNIEFDHGNEQSDSEVRIFNSIGIQKYNKRTETTIGGVLKVNVANWGSGVYFVELRKEGIRYFKKITIE